MALFFLRIGQLISILLHELGHEGVRSLGVHSADATVEPDNSNTETQKPRSSHGNQVFCPFNTLAHIPFNFGLAAKVPPILVGTTFFVILRLRIQLRSTRSSKGGACGGFVVVRVIVLVRPCALAGNIGLARRLAAHQR